MQLVYAGSDGLTCALGLATHKGPLQPGMWIGIGTHGRYLFRSFVTTHGLIASECAVHYVGSDIIVYSGSLVH